MTNSLDDQLKDKFWDTVLIEVTNHDGSIYKRTARDEVKALILQREAELFSELKSLQIIDPGSSNSGLGPLDPRQAFMTGQINMLARIAELERRHDGR